MENLVFVAVKNLIRYVDAELTQTSLRHLYTDGARVRDKFRSI